SGNLSSASFSSCRHRASTGLAASQSRTCGRRAFRELMFQVASFMSWAGPLFLGFPAGLLRFSPAGYHLATYSARLILMARRQDRDATAPSRRRLVALEERARGPGT